MAPDPLSSVMTAYPVIHHACRRRETIAGGGHRVSAHQATVLAMLDRRDGRHPSALARAMKVAPPTMSLLLNRLERQRLIRRDRDEADRRAVVVRLTSLGERVRSASSLLDPLRVKALLDSMTPEARSQGVAGMLLLARAAESLAGPEADSSKPSDTESP